MVGSFPGRWDQTSDQLRHQEAVRLPGPGLRHVFIRYPPPSPSWTFPGPGSPKPVLRPSPDMVDDPVSMAFNTMPQNAEEVVKKDDQKKETVRTFFPETWIWDLVPVG